MALLAGYPLGSIAIFTTLHISLRAHHDPDDSNPGFQVIPPLWLRSYPEEVRWRTIAIIFDLALDPITSENHPLSYLVHVAPHHFLGFGASDFEARFFKDASRSCHHSVDAHQHNTVAAQCLSFLTQWTFLLHPSFFNFISGFKLKSRPWLTRRRKRIPGRDIPRTPRVSMRSMEEIVREGGPTRGSQLLLSLRLALDYLPALLYSTTCSPKLVELAKCWWNRGYIHLLFPVESARADRAIKKHLLRVGNIGG